MDADNGSALRRGDRASALWASTLLNRDAAQFVHNDVSVLQPTGGREWRRSWAKAEIDGSDGDFNYGSGIPSAHIMIHTLGLVR